MARTRTCNSCARDFERTPDFWPRHPKGYEGLHGTCKACIARKSRERYERTRDAYLERQKQYRKKSRFPGSRRDEYQRDRERRIAYSRDYRLSNPEHAKLAAAEYRTKYPARIARSKKANNAGRRGAPGRITVADINAQYATQRGTCFYCPQSLADVRFHVDHYVPLSKGGTNEPENIVLACPSCNLSKRDKLPSEFRPRKE